MRNKGKTIRSEMTPFRIAECVRALREFGLTPEEIGYAINPTDPTHHNHGKPCWPTSTNPDGRNDS